MPQSTDGLKIEGRGGGPLMTVTYCLTDLATGQWALVDPTYEAAATWRDRLRGATPPQAIYITHGHFDHAGGAAEILKLFPQTPVWAHPDSKPLVESGELNGSVWVGLPYDPVTVTNLYREGDTVTLGSSRLEVIDAPGHCPGSVLLRCGRHLIVGDVIFNGAVGRWDLPGADYETLARSIREKVMTLPDDTELYPGHGPTTTIGEERSENQIVRQMMGE